MAWLELDNRSGHFKVGFRIGERKFKRSLETAEYSEAVSAKGTVEQTLRAIERGWTTVPPGVDIGDFLLSGGRISTKPNVPRILTLRELFDAYFTSLPEGSLEPSTIGGMRQHEKQLYRVFGESFSIQSLTTGELQRFVEKRSKDNGRRGRKVMPTTIKKAIVTLRTVWNWAVKSGRLTGRFPNQGLKYPKATEKPPFQTRKEIEQQIGRGGLSPSEQADLWDCLFLTLPEIDELLQYVKDKARQPFVYPMFAFAAHTGARRSEMVRSRLADIDLAGGVVTSRERKRDHAMITTRRVPISPFLRDVLLDWLDVHPGGNHTFCQVPGVARSRKERCGPEPITGHEAQHHFKRTVAGSKWGVLHGWHLFRHSFCSNCAAKGIDQRIINAWVGHQTEDMVRRYRHLIPDQQQSAIITVFGRQGPESVVANAG
jgi:integrase